MPTLLDYSLVLLAVLAAAGYLIWRKIRAARKIARDWSSGHVEACGNCPAMEVHRARQKTASEQ